MSDAELLAEAKARYRVNGNTVESLHNGEWVVAFYCGTKESAMKRLDRCITNHLQWGRMTQDERRRAILR